MTESCNKWTIEAEGEGRTIIYANTRQYDGEPSGDVYVYLSDIAASEESARALVDRGWTEAYYAQEIHAGSMSALLCEEKDNLSIQEQETRLESFLVVALPFYRILGATKDVDPRAMPDPDKLPHITATVDGSGNRHIFLTTVAETGRFNSIEELKAKKPEDEGYDESLNKVLAIDTLSEEEWQEIEALHDALYRRTVDEVIAMPAIVRP